MLNPHFNVKSESFAFDDECYDRFFLPTPLHPWYRDFCFRVRATVINPLNSQPLLFRQFQADHSEFSEVELAKVVRGCMEVLAEVYKQNVAAELLLLKGSMLTLKAFPVTLFLLLLVLLDRGSLEPGEIEEDLLPRKERELMQFLFISFC